MRATDDMAVEVFWALPMSPEEVALRRENAQIVAEQEARERAKAEREYQDRRTERLVVLQASRMTVGQVLGLLKGLSPTAIVRMQETEDGYVRRVTFDDGRCLLHSDLPEEAFK